MTFVPHFRIELSVIPKEYHSQDLLRVERRTPMRLRKEVERLGRYFQREFDYLLPAFDVSSSRPFTAYLFAGISDYALVWIGACMFEPWPYEPPKAPRLEGMEILSWIWLHPYFRSKGHLAKHWPRLRREHGDFAVATPISAAMLQFLLTHNRDSVWRHVMEGHEPDWAAIESSLKTRAI